MRKKGVLKGSKIVSFAEATRQLTGMTKEEYTKAYDVFKHRVRNYNRLLKPTEKLEAAKTFYYYQKQLNKELKAGKTLQQAEASLNPILQTITNVSSTTGRKISNADFNTIYNELYRRFYGFMYKRINGVELPRDNSHAIKAREIFEKLRLGLITLEEARKQLNDIADALHADQEADDAGIIGSP